MKNFNKIDFAYANLIYALVFAVLFPIIIVWLVPQLSFPSLETIGLNAYLFNLALYFVSPVLVSLLIVYFDPGEVIIFSVVIIIVLYFIESAFSKGLDFGAFVVIASAINSFVGIFVGYVIRFLLNKLNFSRLGVFSK